MSLAPALRIAVRGLIFDDRERLLLVNAWASGSDLWCPPGGGVERHQSLPDNLRREIHEETGLEVEVGKPCLVNEFHSQDMDFHQVDVYFRCIPKDARLIDGWADPEGIVNQRRFFARAEMADIRFKPDSLPTVAWGDPDAISYDPLEPLVR